MHRTGSLTYQDVIAVVTALEHEAFRLRRRIALNRAKHDRQMRRLTRMAALPYSLERFRALRAKLTPAAPSRPLASAVKASGPRGTRYLFE